MDTLKNKVLMAVRIDHVETGRLIGASLRKLRKASGITQQQMASRLDVGQASISKIERRGDVHINSLERYLAALGATLRIEAAFSASRCDATQFNFLFEPNSSDDNQLVFPILDDDIFLKRRDVVLSIRPQYSAKIMDGKKTVELRRRFPSSAPRGTVAYIYSTSPERAIVGQVEISDVIKLPVKQIWKKFSSSAFIKRADFDAYFNGLEEGFALQFKNVQPFSRPLTLSELRERFGFEPPQSFLYVKPVLRKALQDEFANVFD